MKHEIQRTELAHIAAFGLELRRVEVRDLPLLSYWRNQPDILPYMADTRLVTPMILRVWLNKVWNGDTTYPYIAYMDEKPVGFTEVRHVNRTDSSCAEGIFLFGKEYMGTKIAYRILLCLEIVMARLGMRTCVSRIHRSNARSIKFHMKCGGEYVRTEGDFHVYVHEFTRRRQYLKAIAEGLGMGEEFERYLGK